MLRTATVILGMCLPVTVQAECYVRLAMTSQQKITVSRITDVDTLVVPISATQNKCIVTYRALINNAWHTLEGESTGSKNLSEKELCAGAMNQGRASVLSRADNQNMSVETNMVCSDVPKPQVKKVKIGDTIKESEVRAHPNFPKFFRHRGAQCRWFIEPELRNQDLYQYQGIICLSHGSEWRVVDKW
jgi:hypothetical protein